MTPQTTVVADLAPSEDLLSLKPGYAVGDFVFILVSQWEHVEKRLWHRQS